MTMWDSTNPDAIPVGVAIAAGYTDGLYAWSEQAWARLSTSTQVGITVFGQHGIRVCDCETGDLTPVQAASWAVGELWNGRRPTIYSNLSTWPYVVQALSLHGVSAAMVDWWAAHPTGSPHLVPGSVATQYAWNQLGQTGGVNVDWSATDGRWPATIPPVPPPPPAVPAKPVIVAIVDCPTGGYWEVASDGGVFAYGCPFYGSLGGQRLSAPITSACATSSGRGYTLAGADGAAYCFGDAIYHGGKNQ